MATPTELRAQAAAGAALFTESSAGRARAGDTNTAVACQWVGDVHRVVAALWNRAGVHADPYREFFALAGQVLTAAEQVSVEDEVPALVLIAELRSAFSQACAAMNIPLVFPQAAHLLPLSDLVDLGSIRGQILGAGEAADFVTDRIATAATLNGGVAALRLAVDAYVVDVAARTGDQMMLTAAARIVALNDGAPRDTATAATLTAAVKRVLGPVEWVRLQPYLDAAGVRAA